MEGACRGGMGNLVARQSFRFAYPAVYRTASGLLLALIPRALFRRLAFVLSRRAPAPYHPHPESAT
jgi:hypothetical protein